MAAQDKTVTRRGGLALGAAWLGLGSAVGAGWYLWPRPALEFAAVTKPAGYRRLAGQGSSLTALTAGLETGRVLPPLPDSAKLCDIAFAGHPAGPGKLTIASFSDFFCPYCRVLDADLHKIAAQDADITLVWHEVPLLGPASEMAARGAHAARRQGAYEAFQARLIRTSIVPNRAYFASIAKAEGLDAAQFLADMTSAQTDEALIRSHTAFRAFGFAGTPGLAVGRTLINGTITPSDLRKLVALEKVAAAPPGCA